MLNSAHLFGKPEQTAKMYLQFIPEQERASACSDCGECEEKCPQEIPIREKLRQVVENFEA
jgi:predicted aldo/keto reductase-like oxidoreductase